jgi:hypothetical protein
MLMLVLTLTLCPAATEMPLKVADDEEDQAPQQEQQQQALAAAVEGEAAGEEMSAGAQLAAASLGVAAAAVVAWSEYTLAMTGCGLPPGECGWQQGVVGRAGVWPSRCCAVLDVHTRWQEAGCSHLLPVLVLCHAL